MDAQPTRETAAGDHRARRELDPMTALEVVGASVAEAGKTFRIGVSRTSLPFPLDRRSTDSSSRSLWSVLFCIDDLTGEGGRHWPTKMVFIPQSKF